MTEEIIIKEEIPDESVINIDEMEPMEVTNTPKSENVEVTDDPMASVKITPEAEIIVRKVLEKCKEETNRLLIPLKDYELRASIYTGLSLENIRKIKTESNYENVTKLLQAQCAETLLVLLKSLSSFYSQCKPFNFYDLHQSLKDVWMKFWDITDFALLMDLLGFEYKQSQYGLIVMENPELTFERSLFLKKIARTRNINIRPFYYLDERVVIKNTLSSYKIDKSEIELEGSDQFIMVMLMSDTGVIKKSLVTNKINQEILYKWIISDVLPILKSAFIVYNSNPLYEQTSNFKITRYSSLIDMQQYLKLQNIPFSERMCKAELYDMIEKCYKTGMSRIDYVLKTNGHEVIKIPKSLHNLSPFTYMWEYLSKSECVAVSGPGTEFLTKALDTMGSLSKTQFKLFFATIQSKEMEFLDIDAKIEKILEKYKIS